MSIMSYIICIASKTARNLVAGLLTTLQCISMLCFFHIHASNCSLFASIVFEERVPFVAAGHETCFELLFYQSVYWIIFFFFFFFGSS